MVKRTVKPKRPSLPSLIAKADKLASAYIRQKWADHNGMVKCISCDAVKHWKEMHCAHWVSRGSKGTRWHEENLRVACAGCNCYRPEQHMQAFTLHMVDYYGREGAEEIRALGRKVLSGSQVRQLAEEAIAYYSDQLQALQSVPKSS